MLDEALIKIYAQFGITHDNTSLYLDADRRSMRPMPILGDLYINLKENALTTRLATIVSRFVTGSAQSFNQQTNVNLDNKCYGTGDPAIPIFRRAGPSPPAHTRRGVASAKQRAVDYHSRTEGIASQEI